MKKKQKIIDIYVEDKYQASIDTAFNTDIAKHAFFHAHEGKIPLNAISAYVQVGGKAPYHGQA